MAYRGFQPGNMTPAQANALSPNLVSFPVIANGAPSIYDTQYPLGKMWVDTVAGVYYGLSSFSSSGGVLTANWAFLGSTAGDLQTITTEDMTVVTPVSGNINLVGDGSIETVGAGDTATVQLTGLTDHNVLIGQGTTTIGLVAPSATAGVALVSAGAAADPIFGEISPAGGGTGITSITAHNLIVGDGTDPVHLLAPSATIGVAVVSAGAAADPVYGTVVVEGGGTGATSLTDHAVLVGSGTAAVTALAVGATGETLMGSTGADPGWTASPSFGGSVTAATTVTATLGDITATDGDLVLATAGNRVKVATGANATAGLSAAMSGTPGAVTVATTACSATALVFYARATTGGTPGEVSITAQDGTGFTLTSTGNETSTFNWWIIND